MLSSGVKLIMMKYCNKFFGEIMKLCYANVSLRSETKQRSIEERHALHVPPSSSVMEGDVICPMFRRGVYNLTHD